MTLPALIQPIEYPLYEPLVFEDLPIGASLDLSGYILRAMVAMPYMVYVGAAWQNINVRLRFGILEGNGLAANGLVVTETSDSIIEVLSANHMAANGVVLQQTGSTGVFNNFVRIVSLRENAHNGLVVQSNQGIAIGIGVQGNHFQVGQVIANGHSGIVVVGESWANRFEVGPLEHNGYYGYYDGVREPTEFANVWELVNANSNPMGNLDVPL